MGRGAPAKLEDQWFDRKVLIKRGAKAPFLLPIYYIEPYFIRFRAHAAVRLESEQTTIWMIEYDPKKSSRHRNEDDQPDWPHR